MNNAEPIVQIANGADGVGWRGIN